MPPALLVLVLVIFLIGSHMYPTGLDHNPPIYASHVAGMTGMYHHTQLFIGWDRVLEAFCLGWPQSLILSISISLLARITDMSHCIWLFATIFTRDIGLVYVLVLSLCGLVTDFKKGIGKYMKLYRISLKFLKHLIEFSS
jgi:hypothetical protein